MGDHPVKVPAELLKKLLEEFYGGPTTPGEATIEIANKVAQWAADQELDACCEYLQSEIGPLEAAHFRAARRPLPPTLAEQALKAASVVLWPDSEPCLLIISALNRLAELEAQQ